MSSICYVVCVLHINWKIYNKIYNLWYYLVSLTLSFVTETRRIVYDIFYMLLFLRNILYTITSSIIMRLITIIMVTQIINLQFGFKIFLMLLLNFLIFFNTNFFHLKSYFIFFSFFNQMIYHNLLFIINCLWLNVNV